MRRAEAAKRIDALLERVVRADGRYLTRVREVWVFGSFARGAFEVGDVDLAVEFDQTKDEAGQWVATRLAGGFDRLPQPAAPRRPTHCLAQQHCRQTNGSHQQQPRIAAARRQALG